MNNRVIVAGGKNLIGDKVLDYHVGVYSRLLRAGLLLWLGLQDSPRLLTPPSPTTVAALAIRPAYHQQCGLLEPGKLQADQVQ